MLRRFLGLLSLLPFLRGLPPFFPFSRLVAALRAEVRFPSSCVNSERGSVLLQ